MVKNLKLVALVLGLTLGVGLKAQQPAALLAGEDFAKLLEEGRALMERGDAQGACPQFFYILKHGQDTETYFRLAEFELARCLDARNLPLSAYVYLSRVVDAGKAHPGYLASIALLLKLSDALEGDTSLTERMAQFDENDVPAELRDRVNYLAGKFLYQQGDLEKAAARFLKVGTADETLYLRARFHVAVTFVRQAKPKDALDAFKDVLRFREAAGVRNDFANDLYLRTYLNMARLFYSVGDFETALRYYANVAKDSEYWLQSLFEASWAYFRLGNFSKAMGNLWTISSPYFEDEFYPEVFLVEANILFENCHYDEALDIITKFHEQYYKLYTELKNQLNKYEDPNEFYFYLARLSRMGGTLSLEIRRIINAAFQNANLKRLLGMVVRINDELKRIEDLTRNPLWNDLANEIKVEVGSYKDLIVGEAGDLSKARLKEVYGEIKELLAKGIKLKIETINARKKLTAELKSTRGEVRARDVAGPGDAFWPFNGEYWRDELENYYFVIDNLCSQVGKQ
jgi:tetratricopeptide (TPR) repeat protein